MCGLDVSSLFVLWVWPVNRPIAELWVCVFTLTPSRGKASGPQLQVVVQSGLYLVQQCSKSHLGCLPSGMLLLHMCFVGGRCWSSVVVGQRARVSACRLLLSYARRGDSF